MKTLSLLLILSLGFASCGAPSELPGEEALPAASIRAVAVRSMKLQPTIKLAGVLVPVPENNAVVSAPVAGQIQSIGVHEGDAVRAGDTLATLDTRLAEADLARAQAALREMKATLALLKRGPVREEIESARQESVAAAEQARALQVKQEALRPLRERGEISTTQFDQAVSAATSAVATGAAAAQRLKLIEAGARPEAVEEAEARVASAQADVDAQQLALSLSTIQSPISGVVAELPVRIGMAIERSVLIARVTDLSALYAQIRIPAPHRAQVRAGAEASLHFAGISEPRTGTVARISVEADAQTGDVDAFVHVANADGQLQPGLACDLELRLPETDEGLAVPISAVTNQDGESVVTVIRDGKAASVVVETGERTPEFVAIIHGLNAGDVVATEGGYGLPEGSEVQVTMEEK